MNIIEALQFANDKLKSLGGQDSSMLDAQILLSAAMGLSKTKLVTTLNQTLTQEQKERFESLVARRLKHEPVAYLIGRKEFFKRLFIVTPEVLIPRPDTEVLIEEALAKAAQENPDTTLFADIGTGSGAIAVTLAAESSIPVVAIDVSAKALTIAKENARANKVEDHIDFREGSLIEPLTRLFKKLASTNAHIERLILCANLPYLADTQWSEGQAEIHFEPPLALRAGPDGLDLYFQLFRDLARARNLFPARLCAIVEIDPAQAHGIQHIITHDFPDAVCEIKKDLGGLSRVVIAEL